MRAPPRGPAQVGPGQSLGLCPAGRGPRQKKRAHGGWRGVDTGAWSGRAVNAATEPRWMGLPVAAATPGDCRAPAGTSLLDTGDTSFGRSAALETRLGFFRSVIEILGHQTEDPFHHGTCRTG